MADQTESSIVVDAPPDQVMDVIADFESYPTWAKGVKSADVVKENPRAFYAIDDSGLEFAPLERGSSRRIINVRLRPANIRVIHRRCRSADQTTGFQRTSAPGWFDKPGADSTC